MKSFTQSKNWWRYAVPLYDYKCPRCGSIREELMHTFKGYDLRGVWCENVDCTPATPGGKNRMTRQPSAPSFVIKGAAYRNGYSGKGE